MTRYIKSFINDTAIQAAVDDGVLGHPYVALDDDLHKIDWDGKDINYAGMYLTIEAMESGDFYVRKACSYSKNGGEWVSVTGETAIAVENGDKVRFKGNSAPSSAFTGNTLSFNVFGNIHSFSSGDNFSGVTKAPWTEGGWAAFMFYNSTGLVSAEGFVLPATTVSSNCYKRMFQGCTGMIKSPKILPALSVDMNAYEGLFNTCSSLEYGPVISATATTTQQGLLYMFKGCTSLKKAPDLLIANLTPACYQEMFKNCPNLSYVKCLATNPGSRTTKNWISGVSATGTFIKDANTTWSTGANGIPSGWTVINA